MNIHLLNELVNSLLSETATNKQNNNKLLRFIAQGVLTEEIVTKTTPSPNPLFIFFFTRGHISPISIFKKIQIAPTL